MDKKILIIPSWYPNIQNDLVGSFFKEQALLLNNNGFEIKILFGIEKQIGFFKYLKFFFTKLFNKNNFLSKSYLKQDPIAYSFDIYHYKKWSSKIKLRNSKKQYDKAFKKLIKDWQPSLIHAQCTANAGIYAYSLSNKLSIPFVIIEHQTFLLHHYKKKLRREMIKAIENASKIGAVSYHQQRCILMNGIDCNPEVIWNLTDESKFKIAPRKPNSKFTILAITYPYLIKDNETFFKSIDAFNKISDSDFEVIIIGNDSFDDLKNANSSIFKALAKKYNVIDKCVFFPKLSREEVNEQLQQCDIFVSTSVAETYGIAVREAMLCGKPVVVTKSGGVEDSITNTTGIAVNIKDYQAIAKNLLNIKNGTIIFSSQEIRNYVIEQSGKKAFLNAMTKFYN